MPFVSEVLSCRSLVKAFSGSLGSSLAFCTFYPLDLLRTRLQVDEGEHEWKDGHTFQQLYKLIQSEGLPSLYAGILPNLYTSCVSYFVYFFAFHGLKHAWPSEAQNVSKDTLFSYLAGVINVLLTTPLWVASMRLKLQRSRLLRKKSDDTPLPEEYASFDERLQEKSIPFYAGLTDALCRIAKDEGIRGLWQGCVSSLLLVFNPAIQFSIYEALKRYLLLFSKNPAVYPMTAFLLGAIAKFVATVLTYPLQVVQSVQRAHRDHAWRYGFMATIVSIINDKGPLALFRGLQAKLWQTVLTSGLMFLIYEQLVRFVHFFTTTFITTDSSCAQMYR